MTHDEKLRDIREHPERHRHHDLNDLTACCMTKDGAIDISILDAHEGTQGGTPGHRCDVKVGPCSCGGWH